MTMGGSGDQEMITPYSWNPENAQENAGKLFQIPGLLG
jgi:hypothetical protein